MQGLAGPTAAFIMTIVSPRHSSETPSRGNRRIPQVGSLSLDEAQRMALNAAEARQRAEDANQTKLGWLRAVSHELRTPLNAIGGFVQLLKSGARGEVPEKMRADLDRIERNQLHMARLIDDVLHFARLEAGRVHFEIAPVAVTRILLDIQDYIPPDERARGRSISVTRCDDAIVVSADEDKTRQILLNLIANALRHTPTTAAIDVRVEADAEMARIVVKDDGPGVPPDRIETVFEPFYQVGRSLNRPVEGLGLGLTIARELARGMGGDLSLSSEPGRGATFTLSLRRV
jgi:signal transduction histidine kinase